MSEILVKAIVVAAVNSLLGGLPMRKAPADVRISASEAMGKVVAIESKPISVFPEEAKRFR